MSAQLHTEHLLVLPYQPMALFAVLLQSKPQAQRIYHWGIKKGRIVALRDIDFDALADRFDKQHKNIEFEWLKNLLSYKLKEMIKINNSRIDYQKSFEKLIET